MFEGSTLIEASQQQQVVDEGPHPVGLFLDPAHGLGKIFRAIGGATPEQLCVSADRGERGAQLVRRVTDEPTQADFRCGAGGERGLDLLHHLVEREPEPSDLGVFVDHVDASGEVARCDRAGRLLHLLERAQSELDHPPRKDRQDDEHGERDDEFHEEEVMQGVVDVGQRDGDDE